MDSLLVFIFFACCFIQNKKINEIQATLKEMTEKERNKWKM